MCGMNWYKEQLAKADDDADRLEELQRMMEERYRISASGPEDLAGLSPDIIAVYKEIVTRRKTSDPA